MDVVEVQHDRAVLALGITEVHALMNSINEAFEAVEDWEFSIRFGVEKDFVKALWTQLDEVSKRLDAG
ncbi:hypothetical protein [Umezawaea sp. Da 62-37]|uniref:hypothetical protein n=1 Tax=Umezawaea sp. Da 62-37 TaxID=3075927 RepID=UPI0028F71E6B|nr:hypothetical protein [Umezawaea sp. Da 62-37]WNV86181.1 hypothetical protein RM788_50075 [Umezawaea sp. Da 62-37]